MLFSSAAAKTPSIKNVGADPTTPRIYGLTSQADQGHFINDGRTAYTQAILYYVTGDETYRANAMRIIRLWGKWTDAAGNPTVVYHGLSGHYRGRMGQNTWESFYYYKYTRGMNMEKFAPNLTRFFSKALDAHSAVVTDASASYIRTTATEAGSKFVLYGYGYGTSSLAFKIRAMAPPT